jgi:hypothetical protein
LSSTSDDFSRLLRLAESILERQTGLAGSLRDPVLLKDGLRCRVVRCQVGSEKTELPSVIVKQAKPGPEAGRVYTDWASLAFLSDLPETRGIAPGFYGGDTETGVFVMEDLGPSRSLEDLLTGSDPEAARRALRELATQTGRLHAHTLGRAEEFERLAGSLPGAVICDCGAEATKWIHGLTRFFDWCDATGCEVPEEFEPCTIWLSSDFALPDQWLAFTHGDPAPTNNHVDGETVRLLDFEFGGFRHALYDITAWYVLCPLPEEIVREMTDCYQGEMAKTCAPARDDDWFRETWARLCAYRALAMLSWIPPQALVENRPWVNDWSCQEAVLSTVIRLHQVTRGVRRLKPIGVAAGRLECALRVRWPEIGDPLPRWPALQGRQEPFTRSISGDHHG